VLEDSVRIEALLEWTDISMRIWRLIYVLDILGP